MCLCEQLHQKAEKSIELNEKILKLLIMKSGGREKITQTLYEPLSGFPICTVEEFQELENNEEKLTNIVSCYLTYWYYLPGYSFILNKFYFH